MTPLRIGTRSSPLAIAQAESVAARIAGPTELVEITTSGDRESGGSGDGAADKSRWVDEIERALLAGEIDLAVHSAKDVPGVLAAQLALIGAPPRADARDALCGAPSLVALAPQARVGTSSLRRAAQLRALRDDLVVSDLGGNVDTRLRRLDDGDYDAIVVAAAGLERLGRPVGTPLDELVPAPGQGTLALEARIGDSATAEAVERLRDPDAELTLAAERALVRELGADCRTPVGAHARTIDDGRWLELRAFVGRPDGSAWVTDTLRGEAPLELGRTVGARLLAAGAGEMLA